MFDRVKKCANTNKLVTNANAATPKNDDVNSSRDVTIKSVIFLAILNYFICPIKIRFA